MNRDDCKKYNEFLILKNLTNFAPKLLKINGIPVFLII